MGKKKSKIAKQKQAKAKQTKVGKKTTLGGVVVTKGFGSKHHGGGPQVSSFPISSSSLRQQKQKLASVHKGNNKRDVARTVGNTTTPPPTPLSSSNNNGENVEFDRQLTSLRERQWAKLNGSNIRRKNDLNISVQLQPASFSVEKTTSQMLHETVVQLESLQGVGVDPANSTPITTNRTWAATPEPAVPANSENRFSALQTDSDDDTNDWKISEPVQVIKLAPASFSFAPMTASGLATTEDIIREDIDPDL